MITAKEARAITESARKNIPNYEDIYQHRKNFDCFRFEINEHIYFEFWNEHEWEFTIHDVRSEEEAMMYNMFAVKMSMFFDTFGINRDNLFERMAMCQQMAA